MLTRVSFQGIVYAAKAVYRFGFVTVNGDKIINANYKSVGPVWCVYCKSRPAQEYRVIRDSENRYADKRPICKGCIRSRTDMLVCLCGKSAACRVPLTAVFPDGHRYPYTDYMLLCADCRSKYRGTSLDKINMMTRKVSYRLEVS